jgi:hypothetical protein
MKEGYSNLEKFPFDRFYRVPCVFAMPEISRVLRHCWGNHFLLMVSGTVIRLFAACAFFCRWVSTDSARTRSHPLISISRLDDGYVKWAKGLGVGGCGPPTKLFTFYVSHFPKYLIRTIASHSPPNFGQSSCLDTGHWKP